MYASTDKDYRMRSLARFSNWALQIFVMCCAALVVEGLKVSCVLPSRSLMWDGTFRRTNITH